MNSRLWQLDVAGLTRAYRRGSLTPSTVMEACLAQIATYNPLFNAFCHLDAARARKDAAASTRRWQAGKPLGLLDCVPVTIKDWYDVKGWPTRQGSLVTSGAPQAQDSFVVSALKNVGAVIIGKTTLPEFGHKGVTHSPLSGITRNPWDATKTSGGSSGGAAVAAATGMGWLHLGSDAGGSIRMPASFCGVVGFKPSPGLMPSWPPSLFSSLSSMGPLARSVDDAAVMTHVLAAAASTNTGDWHNVGRDAAERALHEPSLSKRSLRIAVSDSINGHKLWPEAQKIWNQYKKHFKAIGTVKNIDLKLDGVTETFTGHWTAVASLIGAGIPKAKHKLLDERFKTWIARGDKQHLHDYLRAQYQRMIIGGQTAELFADYDLLITPATVFTAFNAGIDMPMQKNGKGYEDWNVFSAFANLARLPAISLPIGPAQDSLPLGVQICAPYLHDGLVLAAARRLEKEFAFKGWLARSAS